MISETRPETATYMAVTAVKLRGKRHTPGNTLALTLEEARAFGTAVRKVGERNTPSSDTCSAETKRCDAAVNPRRRTPACCREHNLRILSDVAALLDGAGIPWWIDYGLLLGYCTGGEPGGTGGHEGGEARLYWNDKDTDLNCLADDRNAVLALGHELRPRYRVHYQAPVPGKLYGWGDVLRVLLSRLNHTNCDVTFWKRDGDMLDRDNWARSDQFKGRATPAAWVFPTKRGTIEGVAVNVPAEPALLVAHRYGESWRNLPSVRHGGVVRK